MTREEWNALTVFREEFKAKVDEWNRNFPELKELQKKAALEAKIPEYPFETPVVYNTDLDKITPEDKIRLIVIGDNPGKDEQLSKNQRYLVGQAGKIAEGFFRRNPELGVDFRKNVIILNKTPIHSAKTAQLKKIVKFGGESVEGLIKESQLWMAEKTARLHRAFYRCCELWLVGYSELKEGGFFTDYRDALYQSYRKYDDKLPSQDNNADFLSLWDKVFVFQHFSMNRFTIDLADFEKKNSPALKNKSLIEKITQLGIMHKNEVFKII